MTLSFHTHQPKKWCHRPIVKSWKNVKKESNFKQTVLSFKINELIVLFPFRRHYYFILPLLYPSSIPSHSEPLPLPFFTLNNESKTIIKLLKLLNSTHKCRNCEFLPDSDKLVRVYSPVGLCFVEGRTDYGWWQQTIPSRHLLPVWAANVEVRVRQSGS